MFCSGRVILGVHSQKTPKFGPSNCLTNIFLHYWYVFQLFMLSNSKVCSNNRLTNNFLHCEFQFSMFNSSKVSFWEKSSSSPPPLKGPQIWSKQLSHKYLPTLWVSAFYVEQFKSSVLGVGLLTVPWRTTNF